MIRRLLSALPRSAARQYVPCTAWGRPFPAAEAEVLSKVAADHSFVSPFWVSERIAAAAGITLRPEATPVNVGQDKMYNAEETDSPERIASMQRHAKMKSEQGCEVTTLPVVPLNVFGDQIWGGAMDLLLDVGQAKNFASPYWVTRLQARAMGVDILEGAEPTVVQWKHGATELFNASQTSDPSKFNSKTCVNYTAEGANGPLRHANLLLRLRTYAQLKGFTSNLWLTKSDLIRSGRKLLPGASGLLFTTGKGMSMHLYNAEESSDHANSDCEDSSLLAMPLNVFGDPVWSGAMDLLLDVGQAKNFASPYWVTRLQARAMGVDILEGAEPTVVQWKHGATELFNASQTSDPSKFNSKTCVNYTAEGANGPLRHANLLLRLRTYAQLKGFTSNLWLTSSAIAARRGSPVKSATGVVLMGRKDARVVRWFNVEETSLRPSQRPETVDCRPRSNQLYCP